MPLLPSTHCQTKDVVPALLSSNSGNSSTILLHSSLPTTLAELLIVTIPLLAVSLKVLTVVLPVLISSASTDIGSSTLLHSSSTSSNSTTAS
jgi:hypothetical protein